MLTTQTDTSLSLPETGVAWGARHAASAAAGLEQALQDCTPPVARLERCRRILIDLGEDMSGRDWPARLLAFALRYRTGPFTYLMHRLTGERPAVETIRGTEQEYQLNAQEIHALGVMSEAGMRGWERWAWMRIGEVDVAKVRLRLIPARIGGWAGEPFTRIREGTPCGEVLPGLHRADRAGASVWPCNPAVIGAATLRTATGTPFGFAGEQVTGAACNLLSGWV